MLNASKHSASNQPSTHTNPSTPHYSHLSGPFTRKTRTREGAKQMAAVLTITSIPATIGKSIDQSIGRFVGAAPGEFQRGSPKRESDCCQRLFGGPAREAPRGKVIRAWRLFVGGGPRSSHLLRGLWRALLNEIDRDCWFFIFSFSSVIFQRGGCNECLVARAPRAGVITEVSMGWLEGGGSGVGWGTDWGVSLRGFKYFYDVAIWMLSTCLGFNCGWVFLYIVILEERIVLAHSQMRVLSFERFFQ